MQHPSYVQCIEKTKVFDFFYTFLEANRCDMEQIGVCSHVVKLSVPYICLGFFVKKVASPREEGKKWQIFVFMSKVMVLWCESSVSRPGSPRNPRTRREKVVFLHTQRLGLVMLLIPVTLEGAIVW